MYLNFHTEHQISIIFTYNTYESKPNFSQLWNEDQNLLGYTVCYGTHCNFYEFAKRFFGYLGLELRTYKVFL